MAAPKSIDGPGKRALQRAREHDELPELPVARGRAEGLAEDSVQLRHRAAERELLVISSVSRGGVLCVKKRDPSFSNT